MSEIRDRWPAIEEVLRGLRAPNHQAAALLKMRAALAEEASLGSRELPDYTLHNQDHSDNMVLLLDQLRARFRLDLAPYEAYLLVAGIYLHDVGMYVAGDRFRQDILPNWQEVLPFCPDGRCDRPELYSVDGKGTGDQIRELHNVLSAYLIDRDWESFGLEEDDVPYVVHIARGHRRVDLRTHSCDCYDTELLDQHTIRVALLASLARLLDAMDFSRNRAPRRIFHGAARDFLDHPIALEHWTKHYLARSSEITPSVCGGETRLLCIAHFGVAREELNGRSYKDFFEPLIADHISHAQASDLNIDNYRTAELYDALGIKDLVLEYDIREGRYRRLPEEVVTSIQESGAQDAPAFLQWLRTRPTPTGAPAPGTNPGTA